MRSRRRSPLPSSRPSIAVLLGADVGGSHTTVAIARGSASILARAEGPGAAMRPGGGAVSAAVIAETGHRAAAQAGIALPADALVVGAAGAGRAPERRELTQALEATGIARRIGVLGDAEVALHAAFQGGPGILLNAGTGSIAFARDAAGTLHRAGGYGWQIGDEGGGYWLGRRALAAAARAQDGREEGSTLLARLLAALELEGFDDLVRWAATAVPAQVAALAPHLLAAAQDGEEVARRIVTDAARELADLVRLLERHFPGADPVPLASSGSLLARRSPLVEALRPSLAAVAPRLRLVEQEVDAVAGALGLAAELLSGPAR